MTKRYLRLVFALLVVLAVAEGVWLWQLLGAQSEAILVVGGTNAGIALADEDGRVIVHAVGRPDDVLAEGHLDESFKLEPGSYDVRVVFSKAQDQPSQWLKGIALESGEQLKRIVDFGAGELRVDATGNHEGAQLLSYVYPHGDHDNVVTSMSTGEPVLISPGVYDVRTVLTRDSHEKDIRWREQVPVKAGLQTRLRVAFQRGRLLVNATNAGQPLPAGAVELSAYRAGDSDRVLIESGLAGTALTLAAGGYDVRVTYHTSHDKPVRWLRGLRVEEDATVEADASFASGTIVVAASTEAGEPLDNFQAYAYFYKAGEHEQAVAYVATPAPVVLEAGRYDLRLEFFRSGDRPTRWLRGLELAAGGRLEQSVTFATGELLVRAYDAGGNELIGDTVFVHVFSAGQHGHPVTTVRSGEKVRLGVGDYDLRVEDTRRPDSERWLAPLTLSSGARIEPSVTLE